MRIGAHVDSTSPLETAAQYDMDIVQFYLSDPQGWSAPPLRPDAEELKNSNVDIIIHAPYVINVATSNNRVRVPGRRLLMRVAKAAAAVGAKGLVVHGGHVLKEDDPSVGIENWRKAFEYAEKEGGFGIPILIENTAGGTNPMTRYVEQIARLWDAIGEYEPGFCLDTCHAWAAGEDLLTIVDRLTAICGKISLVHANNSRDAAGSGRDRHANMDTGEMDPMLIVDIIQSAQAPAILETPKDPEARLRDLTFLRKNLGV